MSPFGFLKSLFGGSPPPPALRIDPALGDPAAATLRAGLAEGRWRPAQAALERTKDPDVRQFYLAAIADWPGRPGFLDAWVDALPGSPVPHLVRGVHSVQWAWEARGGGVASTVGSSAADVFFERLGMAEGDLFTAAELDPGDPAPWACLIRCSVGLQHGESEARRRFDSAIARAPGHRFAHQAFLIALSEKWGGSHDAMFAHARESSARAPEGSGLHALVAQAHVERWLYFLMDEDPSGAERYTRTAAVAAEVLAAWERSLGSPAHRETKQTAADRNLFAFAFLLFGPEEKADDEIRKIGDRVTPYPWHLAGDPVNQFLRARREARGRGRSAPTAGNSGATR